jgi:hypothetical protein
MRDSDQKAMFWAVFSTVVTIAIAFALAYGTRYALADHANGPHPTASRVPQQCYKETGQVAPSKMKGATKPCDKRWSSKLYYVNVNGIRILNNEYCGGAGRGGRSRPECWQTSKNAPHKGADEVAGDAIACWD